MNKYKVLVPKAIGAGTFGEKFPDSIISIKNESHTQSFVSIGNLDTQTEAENLQKYIKTKFFRTLLSVLKKTPDVTPPKFSFVPMQDFTASSDIDWSKSVAEIDQQLYKKYWLDEKEIDFIESHVKEMK